MKYKEGDKACIISLYFSDGRHSCLQEKRLGKIVIIDEIKDDYYKLKVNGLYVDESQLSDQLVFNFVKEK